jgi:hypothetical protein
LQAVQAFEALLVQTVQPAAQEKHIVAVTAGKNPFVVAQVLQVPSALIELEHVVQATLQGSQYPVVAEW